jgi:glycosyltransferase involved in cell wall biosynthesis
MDSNDLNMRCMTGASNKAFDYMAAGLPLIVSDLPDWRALFVTCGHALPADPRNPDSIAKALKTLIDNPKLRREMGKRNRDRIAAEWNYETQFAPVLEMLR